MSKQNQDVAKELDAILSELNEKDLSELPTEEILDMRKKVNPYGRTIQGSDKFMNFSITQIHHEYYKKLITTAMIGYLNRMNDEWKVPEGVPVVPVYEYLEDKTKLSTPELLNKKGDKRAVSEWEFNRKWMEKRIIVKEFLEEMFQFNPDEHVRSAYRPNRADKERKPIDTPAANLAVEHLKQTDRTFAAGEKLADDVQKKTITGRDGKKMVVTDKKLVPAEVHKKTDGKVDPTVAETARSMIPPHDTFGRFKTYLTSNYEQLREAVKDLYCEKPELELAINPYSWHDSADDAEVFKKKHRNEVIAEIFTAHSGKWNFFDSFKEQRESVNFYNDNTIVLEEIIKQLERDEKLGQDLMKKRVQKAKAKNELLDGKDAEGFVKWRRQNSEINKLGASHIGDQAADDCPDDAIQVDVWKVAKGGLEIAKEHFYSEAEAPEFVKKAQDEAMAKGQMPIPAELVKTGQAPEVKPEVPKIEK